MNQDFKLKFDEYKDNNPTDKDGEHNLDYYPSSGAVRNLTFAWPNGDKQFFNYSYLITSYYSKNDGTISIEFSTHHVTLKGRGLENLYDDLMSQVCRTIQCSEDRYQEVNAFKKYNVFEIKVVNKS